MSFTDRIKEQQRTIVGEFSKSDDIFLEVTRVKLSQFHSALKCILWDARAQRIISLLEYQQQQS